MNANAANETYDKFADFLDNNPGYTGYLVKVIPQRRNRYQNNLRRYKNYEHRRRH